ncbi:MAG: hypothetical protein ABMB14_08260 [Myxococcota bacterium]
MADADAGGSLRPYTPLLDAVIHLDRPSGTPTELYRRILDAVAATTTVPVIDLRDGYALQTGDPEVTIPADGTARALLDQVVRSADAAETWFVTWSVAESGWGVWFDRIRPSDEATAPVWRRP